MIKNYFHNGANGTSSSNVTATIYSEKRVTLFELSVCVLLKFVHIPQFEIKIQNSSLS